MHGSNKRKMALAGSGIALAGLIAFTDPIADIRVTHDVRTPSIGVVEAKVDLGLLTFSFLHSWKRILR